MKTENELIAEFMGLDIDGNRVTDGQQETTLDKLKYDTSWDWLMPVWHKCREIGLWMSTGSHSKLWIEKSEEIQLALLNDDTPERASKLIYNLIKWFNSQNS